MDGFKRKSQFEKLFTDELKSIYWLENNWISTQRELEETAVSEELKVTFRSHNLLNMEAVLRLERIFSLMNITYVSRDYRFIEDLIADIRHKINTTRENSMVRDAALIIDVQKVLHFAIASYGSLSTLALLMDQSEAHSLLLASLHDKKVNDSELTSLAENFTNLKAANE